jgi:methionyl-tRNA formyltransferase
MKLVFCGTPMFAVPSLERLHAAGFEIQLVVTQPDRPQGRGMAMTAPPVKQSALKLGLAIIQPEKSRTCSARRRAAEAIIVVGYGRIIPPGCFIFLCIATSTFMCCRSIVARRRCNGPSRDETVTGVTTML